MGLRGRNQRVLAAALAIALLSSLVLFHASGVAVPDQEVLINGSFENGFTFTPGYGAVGTGWGSFTNGGSITYGFYDDQWAPVVADGKHSQLIELNTLQVAASESNRYAGIYQTVSVLKGGKYQLQVKGLIRERSPNPSEDKWRYRVQWGYTPDASTDWTKVANWVELPWDKIDERTSPTFIQSFSTSFVAPSGKITLYLRVWKKWGTYSKDINVNLDAISLFGPSSRAVTNGALPPTLPQSGGVLPAPASSGIIVIPPAPTSSGVVVIPPAPTSSGVILVPPAVSTPPAQPSVIPIPPTGSGNIIVIPSGGAGSTVSNGSPSAGVCSGTNYLKNGDFESGFGPGPAGSAVGNYWTGFNNGGLAHYGYYDEKWTKVIADGQHGQLLEINSRDMAVADGNRVSGIFQVACGLNPGATYEFSMWGQMREEMAHPDEDAFRYRVQWGYVAAGGVGDITNWTDVPWNTIYVRETAGAMLPFSAQFRAPANNVVIAVRALKKWGTPNRELDVDLDGLRLTPCATPPVAVVNPCPPAPGCVTCTGCLALPTGAPSYAYTPPVKAAPAPAPACVWYTVKRGDTLAAIAARYRTTMTALMRSNHIANANRIYAGQRLCVSR